MSNSDDKNGSQPKVRLEIDGSTPLTEISVRNARFQSIALDSNVGRASLMVEPGVYQVSFGEGSVVNNKTVAVFPGKGPVSVQQDGPVGFPTANPIMDTSTTHEWHQAPAQDLSREVHKQIGDASSGFFLFVRDIGKPITTRPKPSSRSPFSHVTSQADRWSLDRPVTTRWPNHAEWQAPAPSEGLSLHDSYGTRVCDLTRYGKGDDDYHFFGVSIALPEGNWRLRVTTREGDKYEIPVITRHSWQTQVFTLSRGYAGGDDPRSDLDSASIAMSHQGRGYTPGSQERLFEEAALKALAAGRTLRGEALNSLLKGKFENPIWGLVGAHLLLMRKDPDLNLLDMVINNTEGMLYGGNEPHPDITALRYRRAMLHDDSLDHHERIPFPPMLLKSWHYALEASNRSRDLIPMNSVSQVIASSINGDGPWLRWVNPEEMQAPTPVSIDDAPQPASLAIKDLLIGWTPEWPKLAMSNIVNLLSSSDGTKLIFEDNILQDFDREIALQLRPETDPAVQQLIEAEIIDIPNSVSDRELTSETGDPQTELEWLSDKLRVPQNTVIRSLDRIQQTLEQRIGYESKDDD
jgi:hypothetical protein